MNIRLTALFTALVLSGCASVQGVSAPKPAASIPQVAQLAPQTLAPGSCAMFVWERTAPNRFILFTKAAAQSGQWYDGAQSRTVTMTSMGESNSQKQSAVQGLVSADKALNLSLNDAEEITDGTRYKEGVLRVSGGPDFDRVIPVVGLSSCGR